MTALDPSTLEQASPAGMELFMAERMFARNGRHVSSLRFEESDERRLTILRHTESTANKGVELTVAGQNPIRYLPSIFHESDELRGFLWVIQHIAYGTTAPLDFLEYYFTPMDAPREFLDWIAGWFSVDTGIFGDEETKRVFLQHAVSLFRFRGTIPGLRMTLRLVSGIEPVIFENEMPYGDFIVSGSSLAEGHVLEAKSSAPFFTAFFPVAAEEVGNQAIRAINAILKSEKPAHTDFYLAFAKPVKKGGKPAVIDERTVIGDGTIGMMQGDTA